MSDECGSDGIPVPKWKCNPQNWKKNIQKKKRMTGRKTGEDCKCRRQCMTDLSLAAKDNIITQFNNMESKNAQDRYLVGLVSMTLPRRKRSRLHEPAKRRSAVFHYRVKVGDFEKIMCKQAFMSLHGITASRLRRITSLVCEGVLSPVDQRGGRRETWCKPESCKDPMKTHILSYPFRVAHYGKSGKKTRYLASDLNVKTMWKMYLQKYEPEAYLCLDTREFKPLITYKYFFSYYKETFNYPFGRPRTDIYAQCEQLKLQIQCENIAAVREGLKKQLELHKHAAASFYTELKQCEILVKEGGEEYGKSESVVFDYMQNIPFPFMPVTEMFYARKLWLYVIGFHRMSDNQAFMFPYTELTGRKTPKETVSFLDHFIKHCVGPSVKQLYIFTDACTAQNRNNTVVKYLHHLVKCGRFDYIRHVYPTKGHSYLPCDRDFARIELKKRKQDTVYTPQQWIDIMEKSARNIHIVHVDQSMITDYKTFFAKVKYPVPLSKHEGKWKVTSYKIIQYRRNDATVSTSPSGLVTQTFKFKEKRVCNSAALPKAYNSELKLKLAKARDVSKYILSIDTQHRPYFERLLHYGNSDNDNDNAASESDAWDSD